MSSFLPPVYEPDDGSGVSLPGAKLYFFETESVTPLATYSDPGLTVPHAHPVVADGSGRFPPIFLQRTMEYTAQLDDQFDVTIYVKDDVSAVDTNFLGTEEKLSRLNNNPLEFGALGDGVADESTQVQQAIDANSNIGDVDLLGLTFRCDSQLVLRAGTVIKNGILDFTNCTDSSYLIASGSHEANVLLTGDATDGDASLVVGAQGSVVDGDWIFLGTNAGATGYIVHVRNATATNFFLSGRVRGAYTVGNAAFYSRLVPIKDIALRDLEILGTSTNNTEVLAGDVCENFTFERCRFEGLPENGPRFTLSINVRFVDCKFAIADHVNPSGTAIQFRESCSHVLIDGCVFADMETAVNVNNAGTLAGAADYVTIKHNKFLGCVQRGIIFNSEGDDAVIEGNFFEGYDGTVRDNGIDFRGGYATIKSNRFYNLLGDPIIVSSGGPGRTDHSMQILDNVMHKCGHTTTACIDVAVTAFNLLGLRISGNIIEEATNNAIEVNSTSTNRPRLLHITDNIVNNPGANGIEVGTAGNAQYSSVVINGNTLTQIPINFDGVLVDGLAIESVLVMGNFVELDAGGGDCVNISAGGNVNSAVVVGNVFFRGDYGIRTGATVAIHHVGNVFNAQVIASTLGTFDPVTGHGSGGASGTLVETV